MLPKMQWKTDPELIELMNFLIESIKDSKTPLNVNRIAEEFKEKSGFSRGISCLVGRIYKFRLEIHQLDSIDTETKVRILFGLSASVDEDFLEELRMDAHVEVDKKNRITKYRAKDGSMELEGDHSQSAKIKRRITSSNPNYDPEYIDFKNFLIERTNDSKSPLNVSHLIEEFKEKTGSSQEDGCISGRIYKFRSKIQQSDSIDTETKVKLLFGLSAPIDDDFLIELRVDANVELDESNRIIKYRAKDGSLELEGDHSRNAKMKMTSNNPNYDREYIELTNFLIERTKDSKSPLSIRQLAEEFKENSGSSQEIGCLKFRIYKFRSEVHRLDSIDTATKVRLLLALSASIDEDFLEELRIDAHVELDESNRITKYKAKDGSIELEGEHRKSAKVERSSKDPNYDQECIELMDFLIERTKDSKSPLNLTQLAEEFKEKSGSSQRISCLVNRIARICPKIHELDSIDRESKAKMLLTLSAPVDEDFLNELRKTAHVKVDEKNRITKYKAKDGSLELTGDHSKSAKIKRGWERSYTSKNQNDSDDRSRASVHKTPGSVKRVATEMPNSSKRAKDSSPDRFIKIEDYDPEDSSEVPESSAREPSNPEIQQLRQPKVEDALDASIKTELVADDGYASRIKFLKTIHSLVLNLDMPSLSPLQEKIDKKLRESSSNKKIANEEMIMAMEALMTKIANRSVLKFSETVESISLKEFLCYLKAAILNSELEGLEGLLEKIKERIKEPASKDKNIPVETVASALQYALDGFSF